MATMLLRFPGGRYHATPLGHHVNEGLVEWPPSPWRLLRALIACGYTTQRWSEVPPAGRRMLDALAAVLPSYRLPAATVAHSRHYMPMGSLDNGRERTTLVFDTWAHVGDGVLAVRWDCRFDDEAAALFDVLARHLGYLGRSESWTLAESLGDDARLPDGTDAYPHVDDVRPGPGWEQVSLMAPERPGEYAHWRERSVAAAIDALPLPPGKGAPSAALRSKRDRVTIPFPRDLVACLEQDTAWWKQHGWSQPPGSQRVLYWRRSDALTTAPPPPPVRLRRTRVTTMLLALATSSGGRSALPPCARALPQAERLHRALVAGAGRGGVVDCPELTGRDDSGRPLEGHRHAYVLPVDLDGDGHLDHVVVHAPMGLGQQAQDAVRGLRRTWAKGGVGDLQLALAGQGDLSALRRLPAPLDAGIVALLGPPLGCRIWVSSMPFVLPRHAKRSGKNTIAGQVQAELASRGLPAATVEILAWDDRTRTLRHAARVRRPPALPPPVDAALALRLVFDRPVEGPVALGYGSHFGLGLFAAAD